MNDTLNSTTSTASTHESDKVTTAVVNAVADAKGVSPLDLQPLATVIDPDALETLIASMASWHDESPGAVEFSYSGYTVTVTEDGNASVTELDAQD